MTHRVRTTGFTSLLGVVALGGIGATVYLHAKQAPRDLAIATPAGPSVLSPAPQVGQQAAAEVAAAPAGSRAQGCSFSKGERLAVHMHVQVNAVIHAAALGAAGADPSVDRETAGVLEAEALSSDARGAVLLARFRDVSMMTASTGDLTSPFLVRVDPRCTLTAFARHQDTAAFTARTIEGLAYELNWTWPEKGAASVIAENAVGRYRATYTAAGQPAQPGQPGQAGQGAAGSVSRHTDAYLALWDEETTASGGPRKTAQVEGTGGITVGQGPWFARIERTEIVRDAGPTDTKLSLEASAVRPTAGALDGVSRDTSRYVWEDLLPRTLFPRDMHKVTKREREARAAASGQTAGEAVTAFVQRVRTERNFALTWPPLTAYLEVHPESTASFVAALRSGDVPADARASAWVAVGQARTQQAHDLLYGVVRDSSAPSLDRTRAMFAMIDRDDVGVDLANELAGHALAMSPDNLATEHQRFGREAALGLGMMGGLRGEKEPEIQQVALTTMSNLLRAQTTASGLHPVFAAVGNLGATSTLSLIRPYASHADARVRAGAAQAFRRMAPAATGDFVSEWLAREADPKVKEAIYLTIAQQTFAAKTPAADAVLDRAIVDLQTKPGVIARRAILRTLGIGAKTYPPARAALLAQASYEVRHKTGLYSEISDYVKGDDLVHALDVAAASAAKAGQR
jgi:hypothetical protein